MWSIPQSKDNFEQEQVLQQIIIQKENFERLQHNCLILKILDRLMIKDSKLPATIFNADNVWLQGEIFNSIHMPSLAGFNVLRQNLIHYINDEMMPHLINQVIHESNFEQFSNLLRYLTQQAINKSALYAETIGSILKVFSDPSEKFEKLVKGFKDWNIAYDVILNPIITDLLSQEAQQDVQRKVYVIKSCTDKWRKHI